MRRIRLGMVGGGQGAFIGAVHRIAARIDDAFVLVAGALSSDPARAHQSGIDIGLDPARSYGSFTEMFTAEAARADGIEAVAIVTPNHMHAPVARAALAAGLHVICDKPLTTTVAEAEALAALAAASGKIFAVTYNYSGTPMVRQARAMVAQGLLGHLRVVRAQYAQAWLADDLEATGQKQAAWRTDPAQTGAGGAIGDIGTHAYHLLHFVTGLRAEAVLADLQSHVPGRRVDDNAHVLLRYPGGASGTIWASQVAHGHENDLRIGLYGTLGGLEWAQEEPDRLWFTPSGGERRLMTRGGPGMGPEAARMSRIPAGHPEGYLESFAGLYAEIARAIRGEAAVFPDVTDGADGVRFVAAVVRSSQEGGIWQAL
jgi:predicted dehydrogenase